MDEVDYSKTATLVWPATYSEDLEVMDPHVTILYMGEFSTLAATATDLLEILQKYAFAPGEVYSSKFSIFGEDEKVLVLELDIPEDYLTIREMMKYDAESVGGRDASTYTTFSPHLTLGPADDSLETPRRPLGEVTLGSPQLWWGNTYYDLLSGQPL